MIASMYAVYHGPDGLADIARRIPTGRATILADGLRRLGFAPLNETLFDLR